MCIQEQRKSCQYLLFLLLVLLLIVQTKSSSLSVYPNCLTGSLESTSRFPEAVITEADL